MITKNDCMSLLMSLEERGINVDKQLYKLMLLPAPSVEILKFIVDNQGIRAIDFYEMLRKKNNQKKSPLYKNILKEVSDPLDQVTTLTCLLLQITLFGNKLEQTEREAFLKEVRAEEITRALHTYYEIEDINKITTLLRLIKSDLIVLEHLKGTR